MKTDLALYIHWPFCLSKCPYCDFNSHVAERIDQARWRAGLLAELEYAKNEAPGHVLTSIYFGGGTPSLMEPKTAAALIEAARAAWESVADLEVTLEANPNSAEVERFRDFRAAGINRVSIGVQALDDAALAFLGRGHSSAEAYGAIAAAAETFERYTFDLIYGRPDQGTDEWLKELDQALAVAGDHLSVYQLTIEPGTPFFRDGVAAADEDTGAVLFEATRARLEKAGLPAYEVSNHARIGSESRHNLTYWRGGPYAGIGPGAHGRLGGPGEWAATHQVHAPARWLELVESQGHATAKRRPLTDEERAEEMIMTGLRLCDGLLEQRLKEQTGLSFADVFHDETLDSLVDGGFLGRDNRKLTATPEGLVRLNAVVERLLS